MRFNVLPAYFIYSLLGLGCLSLFTNCERHKKVEAPSESVEVTTPKLQDVPIYQEWVGILTGVDNASIMPQITGYLKEQNYTNGTYVKKGDVLFTIDDGTYRDQANQAKAQLAQAKSQLQLQQYNTNLYKPLAEHDVVSKQQYMDSLINEQAAANTVQQMEANLAQAEKNLSYTVIYSPIDGVAGISTTNRGNLVSPSGQPLAVVSEINPIRIRFAVTQEQWLEQTGKSSLEGFDPGTKMEIILKDGKKYPEEAVISYTDNSFNNETGSIRIEAAVKNENLLLRPGMYAKARAKLRTEKQAMTIPAKSVYSTQGKYFLIVINDKNEANIVPVNVGAIYNDQQIITPIIPDSINLNSKIVVVGVQQALMASKNKEVKLNVMPYQGKDVE